MKRKRRKPMTQKALRAWESDLKARERTDRFNAAAEERRAIKPRLRVAARTAPHNPLDGTRLWGNS